MEVFCCINLKSAEHVIFLHQSYSLHWKIYREERDLQKIENYKQKIVLMNLKSIFNCQCLITKTHHESQKEKGSELLLVYVNDIVRVSHHTPYVIWW